MHHVLDKVGVHPNGAVFSADVKPLLSFILFHAGVRGYAGTSACAHRWWASQTWLHHMLDKSGMHLKSTVFRADSNSLLSLTSPLVDVSGYAETLTWAHRWWASRTRLCTTCWMSSACT